MGDLRETHVAQVFVSGPEPADWEPLGVHRRLVEKGCEVQEAHRPCLKLLGRLLLSIGIRHAC